MFGVINHDPSWFEAYGSLNKYFFEMSMGKMRGELLLAGPVVVEQKGGRNAMLYINAPFTIYH